MTLWQLRLIATRSSWRSFFAPSSAPPQAELIREHWPGPDMSLAAVLRLAGVPAAA